MTSANKKTQKPIAQKNQSQAQAVNFGDLPLEQRVQVFRQNAKANAAARRDAEQGARITDLEAEVETLRYLIGEQDKYIAELEEKAGVKPPAPGNRAQRRAAAQEAK